MLTPEDIQSREFLVSLRGYDRDEVHAFLDEVAEEFATLLGREGPPARTATDPPAAQEDTPAEAPAPAEPVTPPAAEPAGQAEASAGISFAAIGAETQRILEVAQEAADGIRRRAEQDAAELRDARLAEAQQEVEGLREEAAAVNQQILDLTARRDELAGRLRQARETVELALLEVESEPVAEAPVDATTSVLAAEDADEAPADEPDVTAAGGDGTPAAEGGPGKGGSGKGGSGKGGSDTDAT